MNSLFRPDYRLVGWKGEPFCLVCRSTGETWSLSPAEFAFLLRCMPLSGGTAALGIPCPNVYEGDDLQEVMTQSDFLTHMTCTCLELKQQNPECLSCRWYDRCGMGCRAEALTQGLPQSVSLTGIDRRMCLFFNSGCYEKLKAVADKHGLRYSD